MPRKWVSYLVSSLLDDYVTFWYNDVIMWHHECLPLLEYHSVFAGVWLFLRMRGEKGKKGESIKLLTGFLTAISETPLFKIAVKNFRNKTLTTRDIVFHHLRAFTLDHHPHTHPSTQLLSYIHVTVHHARGMCVCVHCIEWRKHIEVLFESIKWIGELKNHHNGCDIPFWNGFWVLCQLSCPSNHKTHTCHGWAVHHNNDVAHLQWSTTNTQQRHWKHQSMNHKKKDKETMAWRVWLFFLPKTPLFHSSDTVLAVSSLTLHT